MNRINLYGGPGVGKSTLAAHLFAHLKTQGVNIELVPELIKDWVYEGRRITDGWQYVQTFSRQFEVERLFLCGGVERIVTDSPLLLQCFYADAYDSPVTNQLIQIALAFERAYPSINFLIQRSVPYQQHGRYHTVEEAHRIDQALPVFLQRCAVDYRLIDPTNWRIDENANVFELLIPGPIREGPG